MLKKIQIEGLFNQFNYEIEFKKEGITILTGPNGYGKTTLLKIIYAFAVKNLFFFFQVPFKKIVLSYNRTKIELLKIEPDKLEIKSGNKRSIYKKNEIINEIKRLLENSSYAQIAEDRWLDGRTNIFYAIENLLNQLIKNNPEFQAKLYSKSVPDIGEVYLIKEQRLIRRRSISRKRNTRYYFEEEMEESFASTIEEYAKELSKTIKDVLARASIIGRQLDSTFPKRLFNETIELNEQEFNKRYNAIKDKQKSLSLYGLSATKEDSAPAFKKENAKALRVYLKDTEEKLVVFDDVLQKLEIFSTILKEKQFAFKQLEISPDFGFKFKTKNGKEFSLIELSSGEQQEVVLLYELLFRVRPNTLVLIDEPEISLHVVWQKEVLNDLLKILKLQKITVIIATHSPQIIGEHWDLVVDLEDLSQNSK